MKRILTIFLLISLVFIIACNNNTSTKTDNSGIGEIITNSDANITEDNSLKKVMTAGKLVLGLDDTFAPMGFKDSSGEIVGFDIDLAKEVAVRMGVSLETKAIVWSNSTAILTNGTVDVLWNGLNINDSRKQSMIFSKPYLNNRLVIVKSIDDNTINSLDDLAGKTVGVQYGGNYDQIANNPIISKLDNINKYSDNVSALLDLQAGRLDAVIIDDVFADYYINQKKSPFVVVDNTPLTDGLYVVGFRKSDAALLAEVDRILDEMKADGTASNISTKWFGKDIVLK